MRVPALLALGAVLAPAEGVYFYHVAEGHRILIVRPPAVVVYDARWLVAPEPFRQKCDSRMRVRMIVRANEERPVSSKAYEQRNCSTSPAANARGGVCAGANCVSLPWPGSAGARAAAAQGFSRTSGATAVRISQ